MGQKPRDTNKWRGGKNTNSDRGHKEKRGGLKSDISELRGQKKRLRGGREREERAIYCF